VLYGLHQAPQAWYTKLDAVLIALGFHRSESEHVVYMRGGGQWHQHWLIVSVYVDDLVIRGADHTELRQFKKEMQNTFQMADLGLLNYYLGLEVSHKDNGVIVSQKRHALKILAAVGMEGCNPRHYPMENRLNLSRSSTAPLVGSTEYRRMVGALRYLVNTRPDLAYVVGYISRFMEMPTNAHLMTVERVLKYIAGTNNLGCHFVRKGKTCELVGYSDSNIAGDVDTRQSTTRVLFFLGDCLISWQSQKHRMVVLSSCETEYVMATTAVC
jgi:hypothetical protein